MRECETQTDGWRMNVTHEMLRGVFIIHCEIALPENLEKEGKDCTDGRVGACGAWLQ